MSREIELLGGPADGTKLIVPDSAYDWRVPMAPNLAALSGADPLKPVPVRVAVYKRPVNPLDWRWRFDGEEWLK